MAEFERKSITVPTEIASRMAAVDGVNWSQIASRAFECELKRREANQAQTQMKGVVERLRKSKRKCDNSPYVKGKEAGVLWASKYSEFEELQRVASLESTGAKPYLTDRWHDKPRAVQLMFWMLGPDHPFNRQDISTMSKGEKSKLQKENPTSWDTVRKSMFAVATQRELFEERAFAQGIIEGAQSVWLHVKDEL